MDQARNNIAKALSEARCPAVLSSFGKDSMLVLSMVRDVRQDFTVLWFRTGQDEEFARRIIREWDLTVISYAPADVYLLADDTNISMVHEYDFSGRRVPLAIDLCDGYQCALTRFRDRTPQLFLPFDVLLTGYKDTDSHWLKGASRLWEDEAMAGHMQVVTPIRHMTDDQVRANLSELKIPYELVEDELPLCTRCMTAGPGEVYCPEVGHFIPVHQWEKDISLTAFKQRFQLEG